MRRSYCLLSAAVLLALGVIGIAVPTREPVPPAVTETPAGAPTPEPADPVEIALKRGDPPEAPLGRPGDRFRLLGEKRYGGDFFLGYGGVLIAQYASVGGALLTSVGFGDPAGRREYYDASGRSVKKMFLRAPLDFTRVTSGFSHARFHPVLGGYRPHLAVDYGAPIGTPVRAVADAVVTQAGWNGGYGISITLRHGRGYETMYNHLSKVDVRPGERVRQRQVIGRVGSTGLSTAPHLDYRVRKGGVLVNPLGEKFIPGSPVPAHRREAVAVHVDALLERLDAQAPFPARPPGRS